MAQPVFKRINFPMHLRKSLLSIALETAHLNSNIKNLILDKKVKLSSQSKIKDNMLNIRKMVDNLESTYFTEIDNKEVLDLKNKKNLSLKSKYKQISDEDSNLIREINEIKQKLSRL